MLSIRPANAFVSGSEAGDGPQKVLSLQSFEAPIAGQRKEELNINLIFSIHLVNLDQNI